LAGGDQHIGSSIERICLGYLRGDFFAQTSCGFLWRFAW